MNGFGRENSFAFVSINLGFLVCGVLFLFWQILIPIDSLSRYSTIGFSWTKKSLYIFERFQVKTCIFLNVFEAKEVKNNHKISSFSQSITRMSVYLAYSPNRSLRYTFKLQSHVAKFPIARLTNFSGSD
jgi:hypothetical protein